MTDTSAHAGGSASTGEGPVAPVRKRDPATEAFCELCDAEDFFV